MWGTKTLIFMILGFLDVSRPPNIIYLWRHQDVGVHKQCFKLLGDQNKGDVGVVASLCGTLLILKRPKVGQAENHRTKYWNNYGDVWVIYIIILFKKLVWKLPRTNLLQISIIKSRFHYFKNQNLQNPWFLDFCTYY